MSTSCTISKLSSNKCFISHKQCKMRMRWRTESCIRSIKWWQCRGLCVKEWPCDPSKLFVKILKGHMALNTKSSTMSPFDRAYTTSYSPSLVTTSPSYSVYEILNFCCLKVTNFIYHTSVWGSQHIFGIRKRKSPGNCVASVTRYTQPSWQITGFLMDRWTYGHNIMPMFTLTDMWKNPRPPSLNNLTSQ